MKMKWIRSASAAAVICMLAGCEAHVTVSNDSAGAKEQIEKFNQHYRDLHFNMDTPGIFALWADDGVDLMPGEAPMVGKKAIQAWVENILAKMPGYRVTKQEMLFHDIQVSGEWASEWALEHQVVQPPDGKEPIETWGKMALILHRESNGEWKIKQEMWNAAPKQ